jgi:hypothetical protein
MLAAGAGAAAFLVAIVGAGQPSQAQAGEDHNTTHFSAEATFAHMKLITFIRNSY